MINCELLTPIIQSVDLLLDVHFSIFFGRLLLLLHLEKPFADDFREDLVAKLAHKDRAR